MSDEEETIYESERTTTRQAIATQFRRVADALDGGEPVPADEEGTVVVEPPTESEFEVEVEREDSETSIEFELEWDDDGAVETDADTSKAIFELFEDAAAEWRWRLVHDNGNIIADSGEGYSSKTGARQGLQSVKENAPGASVEEAE